MTTKLTRPYYNESRFSVGIITRLLAWPVAVLAVLLWFCVWLVWGCVAVLFGVMEAARRAASDKVHAAMDVIVGA